ncbi:MAG: tyrosine-type recombinase/integrase [Deltaproteobacteria bacterium]|nr:tyrosine-type recombinase/integrase [Deltaproteobacteria bacterium]
MAKLKYRTISKRTVDALSVEDKDSVFWDDKLPGFGVRVYPSGSKVYVVQTRHDGRSQRVTLGRHGVISADRARRQAAETIARIKSGEDPTQAAPGTLTVAELAARYLEEHVEVRCKPSTGKMYKSVVERFILPAYGHLAVEEVEQQHISKLHLELRDIPYQANRALEIGCKLFNLAEEWKHRTGGNPCKFVRKYREHKRERFLTEAEFRRLGEVLDEMESEGSLPAHPAAAIRLLMLTGCRRNEIMELEWRNVDLGAGELRLPDTKTGARLVPLSPAAARVLAELPRIEGNPWVIPGARPGRRLADLNHYWERVRERADLEGVRLHDLRHSFASRALALGESLSMIGKLLGHNKIDTTARYAHLARDSIKASSARVADSIGADILNKERTAAAS